MTVKRLVTIAMLTAVALMIFVIEAQIPPILPAIPGIKMGLANIVSLFTLFWLGRKEAFMVLIVRILLGTIFAGTGVTLLYSLAGGLLSLGVIALFYRAFSLEALWIPSAIGGVLHNIGQLACACWIMHTWAVLAYLPALVFAGTLSGLFTGLIAGRLIRHPAFHKNFQD
ncbi:Gx transporter family protein [Peptococcus simiae]|uniref:Gx transporter family protein n=1 Tax=Peptococcus simiae TaxID=1643805 RepID=A0ABW9GWA0_9FIRM